MVTWNTFCYAAYFQLHCLLEIWWWRVFIWYHIVGSGRFPRFFSCLFERIPDRNPMWVCSVQDSLMCVCVFNQLEMLCRIVPYSLEWKTPEWFSLSSYSRISLLPLASICLCTSMDCFQSNGNKLKRLAPKFPNIPLFQQLALSWRIYVFFPHTNKHGIPNQIYV